jgi:hypothetical protein
MIKRDLTVGQPPQDSASADKWRPKRRSDLTYRTIEGEAVILNREEGRLHQLNRTASFIWDCCDGTATISEIVNRFIDAYEIDSVTARQDVTTVLSQLQNSNLFVSVRCNKAIEE